MLGKAPPKNRALLKAHSIEVVVSPLNWPLQCFARRRARASESHGFNEALFGKCVCSLIGQR